jgi:hypothetical protein
VRIQRTTAASVMPSGEERLGFWEGRRRLSRLRRAGADWERSRRGGASAACGWVRRGLREDGGGSGVAARGGGKHGAKGRRGRAADWMRGITDLGVWRGWGVLGAAGGRARMGREKTWGGGEAGWRRCDGVAAVA